MPEIYDHAQLADKKLAAHVNNLLEAVTINDRQAYMAWLLIAFCGKHSGAVGGTMNTGGNAIGIFNALLVPWATLTFGWTFAISTAAVFSLIAALLILLVRPDRQIAQQ